MDLIFGAATLYADRDAGAKFRCVEYSFKDPLVSFAGILQSIYIEQGSVWAGLIACIQAGAGLVGIGEIMCDFLGGISCSKLAGRTCTLKQWRQPTGTAA